MAIAAYFVDIITDYAIEFSFHVVFRYQGYKFNIFTVLPLTLQLYHIVYTINVAMKYIGIE